MSTTRRSGGFRPERKIVKDAYVKYSENWLTVRPRPNARSVRSIRSRSTARARTAAISLRWAISAWRVPQDHRFRTLYGARVGADSRPRWLDFGANVNYAHTDSQFLGSEGIGQQHQCLVLAMLMAPIYPGLQEESRRQHRLRKRGSRRSSTTVRRVRPERRTTAIQWRRSSTTTIIR